MNIARAVSPPHISVSKRLYMAVSTHTYDDVLTHLHMCVLQRRPLIVAERRLYGHGKPGHHFNIINDSFHAMTFIQNV